MLSRAFIGIFCGFFFFLPRGLTGAGTDSKSGLGIASSIDGVAGPGPDKGVEGEAMAGPGESSKLENHGDLAGVGYAGGSAGDGGLESRPPKKGLVLTLICGV